MTYLAEDRPTREGAGLDRESREWVQALTASGPEQRAAVERLHDLLLRVARGEINRRRGSLRIAGPELDDLAHHAAADAVMAVVGKVAQFRGESRFTTWAFRFVIFDLSRKLSRHFWRNPAVVMAAEDWDRLPDRFGLSPGRRAEWQDLVAALRRAVDEDLTAHQRQIFVAIVLQEVPLDVLVSELGTNRNAIYKSLFDARRKLRRSLAANGYMDPETGRSS